MKFSIVTAAGMFLLGCSPTEEVLPAAGAGGGAAQSAAVEKSVKTTQGREGEESRWHHFQGMCDASALVMLTEDLFAVANDEDNVLRIYSRKREGMPVWERDLSAWLRTLKKSPETDLEGAARIGDTIYWITSHGANKNGKERPNRRRFFATAVVRDGERISLEPIGVPYTRLVEDLDRHPELRRFGLGKAAESAPKSEGALNIEGLATTPEGHLLIGFRNPIPDGKALVVPLLNPSEVIEGKTARLGSPMFLDLGGLGVRSLTPRGDGYLVVAGSYDGDGPSKLYQWDGKGEARPVMARGLQGNPEALAEIPGSGGRYWALSDDGTREIGGVECKELENPELKVFRAYVLTLED